MAIDSGPATSTVPYGTVIGGVLQVRSSKWGRTEEFQKRGALGEIPPSLKRLGEKIKFYPAFHDPSFLNYPYNPLARFEVGMLVNRKNSGV